MSVFVLALAESCSCVCSDDLLGDTGIFSGDGIWHVDLRSDFEPAHAGFGSALLVPPCLVPARVLDRPVWLPVKGGRHQAELSNFFHCPGLTCVRVRLSCLVPRLSVLVPCSDSQRLPTSLSVEGYASAYTLHLVGVHRLSTKATESSLPFVPVSLRWLFIRGHPWTSRKAANSRSKRRSLLL